MVSDTERALSPDERLAQQATEFITGDAESVVAWLEKMGCQVIYRRDQEWHLVGLTGITVGLNPGMDPVSAVAQFGMLLAGQMWPFVYSDAMKIVRTAWSARVKATKETTAPAILAARIAAAEVGR